MDSDRPPVAIVHPNERAVDGWYAQQLAAHGVTGPSHLLRIEAAAPASGRRSNARARIGAVVDRIAAGRTVVSTAVRRILAGIDGAVHPVEEGRHR